MSLDFYLVWFMKEQRNIVKGDKNNSFLHVILKSSVQPYGENISISFTGRKIISRHVINNKIYRNYLWFKIKYLFWELLETIVAPLIPFFRNCL